MANGSNIAVFQTGRKIGIFKKPLIFAGVFQVIINHIERLQWCFQQDHLVDRFEMLVTKQYFGELSL